ncbi:MAG: hypothetical protein U5R31_16755 [Acidimicrobiia bacterium]|nr:hypothetical protein [Acidimicrobiia bacterium]
MTVVLVPVSTYQSRRRIERDLVKLDSDAATKEEGRRRGAPGTACCHRGAGRSRGGSSRATPRWPTPASSPSPPAERDDLEADSEIIEQQARECGMDLRLLDARQDLAWAGALPLGLAPSTLLAT